MHIVDAGYVSSFNFPLIISTILTFTDATSGRTPGEGAAALHLMHKCFRQTNFSAAGVAVGDSEAALVAAGANPTRDQEWRGMLDKFRLFYLDRRPAVAAVARQSLSRLLQDPGQPPVAPAIVYTCFDQVLHRLLSELDAASFPDAVRFDAIKMLGITFLQHMNLMALLPDFPKLWLSILNRVRHKYIFNLSAPPPQPLTLTFFSLRVAFLALSLSLSLSYQSSARKGNPSRRRGGGAHDGAFEKHRADDGGGAYLRGLE